MLKAEFSDAPIPMLNATLAQHKHFFQAYVAIASARDNRDPRIGRGRPSIRTLASADVIASNCGWAPLVDELKAAREKVQAMRASRAAEDAKKHAEAENLEKAKARGATTECSACFDDLPINRQIHCDGETAHFTCYECAENYIKSEVGESRCRVLCTAGCGAPFPPNQLNLLSNKELLEKLAELEQEKAIRDAGLEDLEECPFCDYKAVLPPIEEDFEFRCANPG
jgi:E3 ubiquitin-protein ligase RNF216